jgi:hypothetical protein
LPDSGPAASGFGAADSKPGTMTLAIAMQKQRLEGHS